MPISIDAAAIALTVFAVVAAGMRPLIRVLEHLRLLDHPNERSSHQRPTLVGGGILVIATLVPAWFWLLGWSAWPVLVPCAVLTLLSLADDVRGVPTMVRLITHITAVAVVLYHQPELGGWLPAFLPQSAAMICVGLGWVWFINLFNFMDGIDGITGAETLAIAIGVIAVSLAAGGAETGLPNLAICVAAAAAGFLIWNWHPAKIFMGDVGSVPLGFLLGWLLLALAASGAWAAALILPAYYIADATITMVRRGLRGEAVWRAHREHFYQRAVVSGLSHAQVTLRISAANGGLIVLAVLAASGHSPWALAGAAALVLGLLFLLSKDKTSPFPPPGA
ncbi:MAG: glycosyltransferase family 4 protein [Rhodospirillales bacterium]